MNREIPQVDPRAAYLEHRELFESAFARVMGGGTYILGAEVDGFEREFARYVGVDHAVGVANGTDALEIALRAVGVGTGDVVLLPSLTASPTAAAVLACGAVPRFVDVDEGSYTVRPELIEEALSASPAKAIVVVHLYGNPADMAAILEVAGRHGVPVVEDCAQSHGAAIGGKRTGGWGTIAAFSFYPTKNLGAFGDGGMVVTHDERLAAECRSLRQYGWDATRTSQRYGRNSRLDEVHAALLRVRLGFLDADNERRRAVAACYDAMLAETGLALPACRPDAYHVYHQYVVRVADREALAGALLRRGIRTGVHYPVPAHLQPGYAAHHDGSPLPATEQAARTVLSLPIFPQLAMEDARRVAEAVRELASAAVPARP